MVGMVSHQRENINTESETGYDENRSRKSLKNFEFGGD
jgi:hypothetical protein